MDTHNINLSDYPIGQPESERYHALINRLHKNLAADGMINLVDFLTPEGILSYKDDIESRQDIAFHAKSERHPYGYERSEHLPADHPRNTFGPTESFRLARHHFPNTAIDELYCWPPMRRFIADITGSPETFLRILANRLQVVTLSVSQTFALTMRTTTMMLNKRLTEHLPGSKSTRLKRAPTP